MTGSNLSWVGGFFNAANYGKWSAAIQQGNAAAGVTSVTVSPGAVALPDGRIISPFATNAPLFIDSGAIQETLTPSVVSGAKVPPQSYSPSSTLITCNFVYVHGQGALLRSATYGLQEAINDAAAIGGGVVIVDKSWGGSTTTITTTANPDSGGLVVVLDLRGSAVVYYGKSGANYVAGAAQTLGFSGLKYTLATPLSVNGAINPNTAAVYMITKAGVLADTLAAPTATTDDGKVITVVSATANAHTITATNLLNTGSAANDIATFAAFAGASLTLMAYQATWYVIASNEITFT